MRRGVFAATVLACCALAGSAFAQDRKDDERGDFNVFLRGGIGDFTGDLANVTSTGPTWGLNVNVQPWNVLGYEIAYDGSRNLINDSRLLDAPALTRHGLSALVRIAPPFIEKVRPYVGVGLGVTMASVDEEGSGGLYRNDLMEEVPLAAGLEFNTGAVTAGFRTSYRFLLDESFADPSMAGNAEGGYLDASITLGGRF